jgi:hypothetical protein
MRTHSLGSTVPFVLACLTGCSTTPGDGYSSAAISSASTAAVACSSLGTTKVPSDPESMKMADLNGDGLVDVIVGNTNDVVLTVLLALPGGGYAPARSVPFGVADEAEEFDVADLNGDRIPDLVVAKGYDFGTVATLFGKGDGTFVLGDELSAHPNGFGAGPDAVRIADFNGDGKPDFVTQNVDEPTVSVFLGDGSGKFAAPVLSTYFGAPGDLYAVDLNADGKLDLVTIGGFALGNGDGSFKAQTAFGPNVSYQSVAVGDFNGDHIVDVVGQKFEDILVGKNRTRIGTVELLLGKGGSFAAPTTVITGAPEFAAHMIAAADVDHDGNLDVVTTVGSTNGTVLFGAANGGFPRRQDVGTFPSMVAADGASGRVVLLNGSTDVLTTLHCGL